MARRRRLRQLVLVLGDQLDGDSAAFDGFDPADDAVLMMEVREEATHIPQHRRRLAFFFAAMRHFRDEQRAAGRRVLYSALDDPANTGSFAGEIRRVATVEEPQGITVLQPGDHRVRIAIADVADALGLPLEIRVDRHFLCAPVIFAEYIEQHRQPVLENFYRMMRRRHDILLEPDGKPAGGAWNFDRENRAPLGRNAPPVPPQPHFAPDGVTRDVLRMVTREFPDSPGRLDNFGLPVTRRDALLALEDFITHRLPHFGRYQDAMKNGEPFLFHSLLSGPLNLHMLHPRELIDRAIGARDHAPLAAVEGFVRQVLGWREFVRGIYDHFMPEYATRNALAASQPAPRFLWTGETDMRCVAGSVGHVIDHAYTHHIERLMVLGLFCLLLGVRPYDVHRWHVSMFWDAIDWASLPNTLGMSQHADGGLIGTKPYAASGNYIDRMSDYCGSCRYDPHKSVGEDACPFTTLYYDFLARHEPMLARNPRMRYPLNNLARKSAEELHVIRARAAALTREFTSETFLEA